MALTHRSEQIRAAVEAVAEANEEAKAARAAENAAIRRRAELIAAARAEGATLADIAERLELTVERVRQMGNAAS